jgi:RHS repeat-associated protein
VHSVSYTYDQLNRLKQVAGADGSWSINWTLDIYGNRTAQTPSGRVVGKVGSPSYGYVNNRVTSFTYDFAGNVLNDGVWNYAYDAESRLKSTGGGAVQFTYDEEGRRITRTAANVTTVYFYGQTGLMSEFENTSGATAAASTDRLQYRSAEQTGTAVLLMSSNGTVLETNRVLPYGELWSSFANSTNDQKFTTYDRGKPGQSDAELDYAMARFYANRTGRFMSTDPGHVGATLNDPQSWNAYTYGLNDPINNVDLTGEGPLCTFLGIGCPEGERRAPPPEGPCIMIGEFRSAACPNVPGGNDKDKFVAPGPRVMLPPIPPTNRCQALLSEILSLVQELEGRYWDVVNNKLDLPMTRSVPPHPSGSVLGHQQQFQNKQTQLRDRLNKFQTEGCGGPPPVAWQWATRLTPSPAPRAAPVKNLMIGVGAGYAAYRILRMIPSLYPPLWPTIGPNLAIP